MGSPKTPDSLPVLTPRGWGHLPGKTRKIIAAVLITAAGIAFVVFTILAAARGFIDGVVDLLDNLLSD